MKKCAVMGVAAALLCAALPAWANNPFSDVPQNHWSYDALEELSSKGLLDGYPDGTFRGNRVMNRYEIASLIARVVGKDADLSDADSEKVKALVAEFEPELAALGVKIDNISERLGDLEKNLKGWKITGQFRYDLNLWETEIPYNGSYTGASVNGFDVDRARIYLHKDLANKVTFDARWHDDKWDRFYFQVRDFFGVKGFTFKAGQFFLDWEAADGTYIDNDAYAMDTTYRGIQLTKSIKGFGTVTAFASSQRGSGTYGAYTDNAGDELYGIRAKMNFSEKWWASLNALITHRSSTDYAQYWLAGGWRFMKGAELKGVYYIEDVTTGFKTLYGNYIDDPHSWKVILDLDQDLLGFTGLWLEYAHIDEGYRMDHYPWAFSNIEWPATGSTWNVKSDTEVFFARAEQKWNKKWTTFERFAEYNPDDTNSFNEWTLGFLYYYTPTLSFEVAYTSQDGRIYEDDYDNKQFRLRTFLTF